MDELETSAAFAALTPNAVKVLHIIEQAVGEDRAAALTYAAFIDRGVSRPNVRFCLAQLLSYGFTRIEPSSRCNRYVLIEDWRHLTAAEIAARKILAREPRSLPRRLAPAKPKRPPKEPKRAAVPELEPAEPVVYAVPGLPVLRFMQGWPDEEERRRGALGPPRRPCWG